MAGLREYKEIYWAEPTQRVVEVWRKVVNNPDRFSDKAKERNRQSQIVNTDLPVKVIAEKENGFFIQMADLTRGYVLKMDIKKIPNKDYWKDVKRFGSELVPVNMSQDAFVKILKKWPRVKYVWGGRQEMGTDCSGFVQAVFYKVSGYLLPKNSRDQAKKGVSRQKALVGDIILMENKKSKVSHIGIVADSDEVEIVHLSRSKNRIAWQPLAGLKDEYKILKTRRLIKFLK